MSSRIAAVACLLAACSLSLSAQAMGDSPASSKPAETKLGAAMGEANRLVMKTFTPLGRTEINLITSPVHFEAAVIGPPNSAGATRGVRVTIDDKRMPRASLIDMDEIGDVIQALNAMIATAAKWDGTNEKSYRELSFTSRDNFRIGFYQDGKDQMGFVEIGLIDPARSKFRVSELPKVRDILQQALEMLTHPGSAASTTPAP